MSLLTVDRLTVEVAGRTLIRNLSLAIEPGQRWCLLGNNGAGKTRLLETLVGLHAPASGRILLEGRPLAEWPGHERARRIGLMPQHEEDPFPLPVAEAVAQGAHPWHPDPLGLAPLPSAVRERLDHAMLRMELEGLAGRNLQTLSGGERRRVTAAMLLVQSPRIFLLDEPTNHLDLRHRERLLAPFVQATQEGHALVVVTHDLNLAEQLATHVLLVHDDGICERGPRSELLREVPLQRLFETRLAVCRNARGERIWYVQARPTP